MTRRRQEEKEEQERVTAELKAAQRAAAGVATGGTGTTTSRGEYSEQPSQGAQGARGSGGGVAPKVRQSPGAQSGLEAAPTRIPTQATRTTQGNPQRPRAVSQPGQPRPVSNQPVRPPLNTYPQQQPQTPQTRLDPSNQGGTTRAQGEPSASTQRPAGSTQQGPTQTRTGTTSTFPHAFERWETLSSHWEGLTNFWIKRLEGNSAELKEQPINQQLARQVTDLSAAGANLFHAVVELQRLRASSERKFQRWFFETREEHERNQERIAQLEAELNEARRNRSTATATTTDQPSSKVREEVQEQARREAQQMAEERIARIRRETEMEIKEKNRELEISKEEARRGWEEIGRMEQENRDRTFSLRRGEPTIVGGVQVVPFIPAGASRQTSTSRGPGGGGLSSHPPHSEGGGGAEPGYTTYDPSRSETDTDPFTESGRDAPAAPMVPTSIPSQPPTSAAAMQAARASASPRVRTGGEMLPPSSAAYETTDQPVQAPTTAPFYQQHGAATALHSGELGFPRTTGGDQPAYAHSEDSLEEEGYAEDEHGNPILTRRGPASEGSEEYDVIDQLQRDRILGPPYGPGYTGYSSTSNGSGYSQQPDYSGQGYGRGDWDLPRHHHPTRLSDVPEEDERSRTSPSRASQRSRGLH